MVHRCAHLSVTPKCAGRHDGHRAVRGGSAVDLFPFVLLIERHDSQDRRQMCIRDRVHGIASAHGPVAVVTAGAFGAALLSVSVKF